MDCMLCSSKDVEEEKGFGGRGEEVRSGRKMEVWQTSNSLRGKSFWSFAGAACTVNTSISRGNGHDRHPGLAWALFLI